MRPYPQRLHDGLTAQRDHPHSRLVLHAGRPAPFLMVCLYKQVTVSVEQVSGFLRAHPPFAPLCAVFPSPCLVRWRLEARLVAVLFIKRA